jgi:hypothetical protein
MREGGAKGIGDDGAFKAELLWRKAMLLADGPGIFPLGRSAEGNSLAKSP